MEGNEETKIITVRVVLLFKKERPSLAQTGSKRIQIPDRTQRGYLSVFI